MGLEDLIFKLLIESSSTMTFFPGAPSHFNFLRNIKRVLSYTKKYLSNKVNVYNLAFKCSLFDTDYNDGTESASLQTNLQTSQTLSLNNFTTDECQGVRLGM